VLKTRIIPTLLLKGHTLVKDRQFAGQRPVGTLLPAVRVYNSRDVDELVILDVAASRQGRGPDISAIERAAAEVRVPLSIGGGVTTVADFESILQAGADKVVVNSAVFDDPTIVRAAADRFGSQCVIVSIDVLRDATGRFMCVSHSGSSVRNVTLEEHVKIVEAQGAGELLVCSIEHDGEMSGYDLEALDSTVSVASVPIILSGGCGSYAHMHLALSEHGASAVAAASIFHFTEQTPLGARAYLADQGLHVRDSEIATQETATQHLQKP